MVRVGTPSAVARPAWYDRNPISRVDSASADGVTPHGATDRLTYTVPAGKKALIEQADAKIWRQTAATTAGEVFVAFTVTPGGGSQQFVMRDAFFTNAVNDSAKLSMSPNMTLKAGDVFTIATFDGSTGGTTRYRLGYKLTEYDA